MQQPMLTRNLDPHRPALGTFSGRSLQAIKGLYNTRLSTGYNTDNEIDNETDNKTGIFQLLPHPAPV